MYLKKTLRVSKANLLAHRGYAAQEPSTEQSSSGTKSRGSSRCVPEARIFIITSIICIFLIARVLTCSEHKSIRIQIHRYSCFQQNYYTIN